MIAQGFRTYFPHITIIGEESTEYTDSLDINFAEMASKEESFFPSYVGLNEELSLRNYMESSLWIDPLDCTQGFINGSP